jgi:hypothetical protein
LTIPRRSALFSSSKADNLSGRRVIPVDSIQSACLGDRSDGTSR